MPSILLATNNKDKIIELQGLLKDLNLQLLTPADIDLELDVIEDGLTYAENASKKALAFAQASGLISLTDDSGLEVDALNGEPGLYSARYGSTNGKKLSAGERRKYLLGKLQDHPRPWTARFKATIAIAVPTNVTLSETKGLAHSQAETLQSLRELRVTCVEGICEGEIIPEERGTGGFGYDPIFLFPELGKTMSELGMDEKNRLSHRARAVVKTKEILKSLFAV
ncbi:MAG TPA: non-canonical purine NTP pyrophosphatase [Anaerolineales bacterium]|nr:non-canonical purine NTP pyrophosphatase [Anaerolineales bacterium]HNQ93486.1 non-canonical purine NTP pyrophosphatase [Anaerolineales bacterium]HNS60207.1 non-canonical purine NTP pyrophosphatase [Anaerolineales bacterium]